MKRRTLKLYMLVLIILVGVFGFASVAEAITINTSTTQDGSLEFQFRTEPSLAFVNNSFMQQDWGEDYTSDLGMYNVWPTGQNLAATNGLFTSNSGDGNFDTLATTVSNPYDGYYNEFSVKVTNVGTESLVMQVPVLNWMGQPVPLDNGVVKTLYDAAGNAVLEVRWLDNTGKSLCPGGVFEDAFEFHIIKQEIPKPQNGVGLTPGYWKNWRNHYTPEQFTKLLDGTIAPDIATADMIFANYNAKQKNILTILKAQLLATQLTINLSAKTEMPNPDGAYLSRNSQVQWNDQTVTVGQAVDDALKILANSGSYTREQILTVKDLLDMINNLRPADSL